MRALVATRAGSFQGTKSSKTKNMSASHGSMNLNFVGSNVRRRLAI